MRTILSFLVLVGLNVSCTISPNSSAVPFLWNDEPSPESYQIMVVSDLDEERLNKDITQKLNNLGFLPDFREEGVLHTEPKPMGNNILKITLDISDNMVIVTGFEGSPRANIEDVKWKPVYRGEDAYGSSEWEIVNLFAQSLNNTSILYN